MFADVRGYTPIAADLSPAELAYRMTTLHRWAAPEVGKRQGVVDKFAGDAVMATFNATGPGSTTRCRRSTRRWPSATRRR